MTKQPIISIIIPVYNTLEFLDDCISSLPLNIIEDIQIIFVDNCSTDGSYEYLIELSKTLKKIELYQVKGGKQARCRNFGIQKATGKYIGFCDSDDWCAPNMFTELLREVVENDADIAIGQVIKSNSEKTKQHPHYKKKYFKNKLYNDSEKPYLTRLTTCYNKIYRKELLIENNITFPEISPHEDVVFAFKVLYLAKTIIGVPNAQYFWRTNPESATQKLQNKKDLNPVIFEMIVKLREECDNLNVPHEWVLAADRLIENHLKLMLKNLSKNNIPSYLEKTITSAGYIPSSIFKKIGKEITKETVGELPYEYYTAQNKFLTHSNKKAEKQKKILTNVAILLLISISFNAFLFFL